MANIPSFPPLEDSEIRELKEKFKYAYSYVLPIWRVLFCSSESNYKYWNNKVNARLNESLRVNKS